MKKLFVTLLLAVTGVVAFAQQGYQMMPAEGKRMVYEVVSKSPMGENTMFLSQSIKEKNGERIVLESTISMQEDGANKSSQNVYRVEGDEYLISVKEALAENLAQLGNIEVVEASDMRYPFILTPETVLEESSMKIKANIQGMDLDMTLSIRNRKAAGEEEIETPAGKFQCIKFTEQQVVSLMGQDQVTEITYWYGKDTGMVKQSTVSMGGMVTVDVVLKKIE